MSRFTVTWSPAAQKQLAELWLDNPKIRQEVTAASDQIDLTLAVVPEDVGVPISPRSRFVVRPPLAVLYLLFKDDLRVRVIYVKHWFD